MNFMTVSTMLSSSSSSPQPVGTAFLGRVRLPSEACSIAAAASASFSSFFLMPYYTRNEKREKGFCSVNTAEKQDYKGDHEKHTATPAGPEMYLSLIYALCWLCAHGLVHSEHLCASIGVSVTQERDFSLFVWPLRRMDDGMHSRYFGLLSANLYGNRILK